MLETTMAPKSWFHLSFTFFLFLFLYWSLLHLIPSTLFLFIKLTSSSPSSGKCTDWNLKCIYLVPFCSFVCFHSHISLHLSPVWLSYICSHICTCPLWLLAALFWSPFFITLQAFLSIIISSFAARFLKCYPVCLLLFPPSLLSQQIYGCFHTWLFVHEAYT